MVEIPPVFPGWPRTMIFRHVDGTLAPPPGYDSWDLYFARTVLGGKPVTTYSSPGTVPRGKKLSAIFTREDEDIATIGLHFVKVDGSEVVDFDDAAYDRCETNMQGVFTAVADAYDPSIALARLVWHDFGVGVRKPNPQVRETIITPIPGTGDADTQLPPQVAVSVTMKTARRKSWGRDYMPATTLATCVAGRFAGTTLFRNAWGDLLDDQSAHEVPLVIWCPRHGGGPLQYGAAHHAAGDDEPDSSSFAITVDQVQVDDLFDVIRSRRYDKALVKATHTLP